jgi:hypothetical protein
VIWLNKAVATRLGGAALNGFKGFLGFNPKAPIAMGLKGRDLAIFALGLLFLAKASHFLGALKFLKARGPAKALPSRAKANVLAKNPPALSAGGEPKAFWA